PGRQTVRYRPAGTDHRRAGRHGGLARTAGLRRAPRRAGFRAYRGADRLGRPGGDLRRPGVDRVQGRGRRGDVERGADRAGHRHHGRSGAVAGPGRRAAGTARPGVRAGPADRRRGRLRRVRGVLLFSIPVPEGEGVTTAVRTVSAVVVNPARVADLDERRLDI